MRASLFAQKGARAWILSAVDQVVRVQVGTVLARRARLWPSRVCYKCLAVPTPLHMFPRTPASVLVGPERVLVLALAHPCVDSSLLAKAGNSGIVTAQLQGASTSSGRRLKAGGGGGEGRRGSER